MNTPTSSLPAHTVDQQEVILKLRTEIESVKRQNEESVALEKRYQETLQKLQEKEEFNFALFQYSPAVAVVVNREGRVIKSNAAKRHTGDRLPNIGDIMYKDYAAHHTVDMYKELMDCIQNGETRRFDRLKYGKRTLFITIAPFPKGAIISAQDITTQVQAEQDRIALINDLRRALNEVETLRGLLPICSSCKKIRDDGGYWNTVEEYFTNRSGLDFSHTVCPVCMEKLYPDIWASMCAEKAKKRENESAA